MRLSVNFFFPRRFIFFSSRGSGIWQQKNLISPGYVARTSFTKRSLNSACKYATLLNFNWSRYRVAMSTSPFRISIPRKFRLLIAASRATPSQANRNKNFPGPQPASMTKGRSGDSNNFPQSTTLLLCGRLLLDPALLFVYASSFKPMTS